MGPLNIQHSESIYGAQKKAGLIFGVEYQMVSLMYLKRGYWEHAAQSIISKHFFLISERFRREESESLLNQAADI